MKEQVAVCSFRADACVATKFALMALKLMHFHSELTLSNSSSVLTRISFCPGLLLLAHHKIYVRSTILKLCIYAVAYLI